MRASPWTSLRRRLRRPPTGRVRLLLGLLVGLVVTSAARAGASVPTWGELLARDVAAGRIDRTTSAWYLLYAVRDRDRLPAEYREAAAREARICATPALVYLRQHEAELSSDQRRDLALLEVRPPSAGFVASALIPARVHWQDSTQIVQAELCRTLLEESWQTEVDGMGFTAPTDDLGAGGSSDFDFYLDGTMAPGNGFSEGDVEDAGTWWYDRSSFIVIGAATAEPLLRVLIAHEFNHSCQWAMDAAEDDAFYENTSSFVEDLVYDDVNDVYNVLPWFQGYPHRSLDYFGETYQYGAFLWESFLADAYGDGGAALIRDLWNASRQAAHQNEPDYFDVLAGVLPPASGDDFDDQYVRFAQWRFFTGAWHDAHHFAEAYPEGVHLDRTFSNGSIPVGLTVPGAAPMEYGAIYTLFLPGAAPAPGDLRVVLSAPPQKNWSVSLVGVWADGDPPTVVEARSTNGSATCILPHREQYAAIALVVVNLGDGHHDPDEDEWMGTSYWFSASLLPAGSGVNDGVLASGARLMLEGANPTKDGAWLRFEGGAPGTLRVWDAAGRLRRSLDWPRGAAAVRWDGCDDDGRRLPAGVYWARDAESASRPVRVVLVR